ncbi:hypothetical protein [Prevotella sp. KH2C16]|uniref:hypothetical protein n=1 Tax=Prevotella sp. KH2C16 TaxID=1855325 RepID=UPI0008E50BD5|nr:hypothetical protein [Prevotella sp. KH2C16]SFF90610.1 hypothetical protein SAMN05216383_10216 [Prevotella sp. KH2C16]
MRKVCLYCIILSSILLAACQRVVKPIDVEAYQPTGKFIPAYQAITNRHDLASGKDYDIERTVCVMNALELAQARSKDFNEYLNYMARLDYSGVAPDVLEAKERLLPILQYMFRLQGMDEELSDLWMLARSAAVGGKNMPVNPIAVLGALMGEPLSIVAIAQGSDIDKVTNSAFEQYKKDKDLRLAIRHDMQALEASYRQYLSDYAPIYQKYMKEYDALCISKDKAYLDLYAGRPNDALADVQSILDKYPDNGEGLLLKACALIVRDAQEKPYELPSFIKRNSEVPALDSLQRQELPTNLSAAQAEAYATLLKYEAQNPARTAPALVLKGLIYKNSHDLERAFSFFDQAPSSIPAKPNSSPTWQTPTACEPI